jgi:CRISPR-associated protein Cas2
VPALLAGGHMCARTARASADPLWPSTWRTSSGHCMEGYGTRIQCSVFICDLSAQETVLMRGDIETRMKPSEDSVMVVVRGRPSDQGRFLFLGHHEKLPTQDARPSSDTCEPSGNAFTLRQRSLPGQRGYSAP